MEKQDSMGLLEASVCRSSVNTTYASGFAYNPASQITGFSYGNGVTAALGFSPDRLQLTSLSYTQGATTLFNSTYSYGSAGSNNGQIAGITDSVDNGRSAAYTYDALYRLTGAVSTGSATYPQWGLQWTYDRYGNRLTQSIAAGCVAPMTCPTNSVAVDAASNHITDSGYAYDANGNMASDGLNTLVYDAENHSVSSAGALGSGAYTYDGNGLRVKKVSGGTTTVYIFSGTKVIAEYDNGVAPASPSREYLYAGSSLLAKIEAGATIYFHQDQLSNRVMTDASGNPVAQRAHYPYGESWYESGTTTKLKFTSYERDGESANEYAMARYDINRLGRFSSPDPFGGGIADPQSLDRYAYTRDDPVDFRDPLGLFLQVYCQTWGVDIGGTGGQSSGKDCWFWDDGGYPQTISSSGFGESEQREGIAQKLKKLIKDASTFLACTLTTPLRQYAQANGMTSGIGFGASGGAGFGPGVQASVSLQEIADPQGNIAVAFTVGFNGIGPVLGIGGQVGMQVSGSSVQSVAQTRGPSDGILGTVGPAGAEYSRSNSGETITVTAGPGAGTQAGGATSMNNTFVSPPVSCKK